MDIMTRKSVEICYILNMTKKIKWKCITCTLCCKRALMLVRLTALVPAVPDEPYKMLVADIGELENGKKFLCIADRYSDYVQAYRLASGGTSREIISNHTSFVGLWTSLTKRIHWENAPNFQQPRNTQLGGEEEYQIGIFGRLPPGRQSDGRN
jgi:hypothetical protein